MKKLFALCILVALSTKVTAQSLTVSDNVMTIARQAGEAQSTVVPPNKNNACQAGRFLVSIDLLRPPAQGLVVGRDLGDTSGTLIEASFDSVPNATNYAFGTNDHDLVVLNNGDVLYATGAFSRMPLTPKPAWFDVTYRGAFGPGARSVVLVWRSTDCGRSFKYLSEFDPAQAGGGFCAMPQFPRLTTAPGSPAKPAFDMGGTDGQLLKVDPSNNQMFMTFQCVGNTQDTTQTQHFELSNTQVNRTLLVTSVNNGASWKYDASFVGRGWRIGVVPLPNQRLALGLGTSLLFGGKPPFGSYLFNSTAFSAPNGTWGWEDTFYNNPNIPKQFIGSNMWASTIVTRVPNSTNILLTFPDTIDNKGHGYRMFFFDQQANKYAEAAPVLPAVQNSDNFILHLVAIDFGQGPVLLYWYDIDGKNKTATLRGRLIRGNGQYSADFVIAKTAGTPHKFNLDQGPQSNGYWYGDYLTAGGFLRVTTTHGVPAVKTSRYTYYPMWVEPDRTIRYTQVEYAVASSLFPNLPWLAVAAQAWKPGPPVELSKIKLGPRELETLQDYSKHSRERQGIK